MDPTANEGVSAFSGLKYFRALMEGSVARSAMLELFDINIEAAEPGLVVLTAIPTTEHYNPLGVVRGEGKTLHVGRQTAIGEGRLLDAKGRLLAHGTTTCHVVRDRGS